MLQEKAEKEAEKRKTKSEKAAKAEEERKAKRRLKESRSYSTSNYLMNSSVAGVVDRRYSTVIRKYLQLVPACLGAEALLLGVPRLLEMLINGLTLQGLLVTVGTASS